jgi:CRP-like cAMP-binding protein
MQAYLEKINEFIKNLDKDPRTAFSAMSTTKTFKKGEFLLQQDQICKRSFLIEKGMARKYYLHDGKEVTTELLFEEDIAVSLYSYVLQRPGKEFIQALSDITVSITDYVAFQKAKESNSRLVELDLMMTEYYALWLEERLFHFHTLDATNRYLLLLQKHPHVVHNIPLTYIASYLGISLETLSRIRAKI